MIISIFLGSTRRERQGKKVADWVARECKKRGHTVHFIDPLEHEDLLVLKDKYSMAPSPSEDFTKVHEWVKESDAYIAVTPEYNHGYSGALKTALDCFFDEYDSKYFAIVTYSAGSFGGVRAAEPLRCVCAELGAPAIPISMPVSNVFDVFDESGKLKDTAYEKRVGKMLTELENYTKKSN